MNTAHYRDLRERSIDLLIGRIPDPFSESELEAKIVCHDQMVVVVGRRSKWVRSRRLALSELVAERWVLPPQDTMPGSLAGELFRADGADLPSAPITTLSMHLCCQLAASSKFVTMLPASILRFNNLDRALKVLPVKLVPQRRPVGIVTLKSRTLTPAAKLFIECVHRTAA
jgi:DNA-binding transcriptional LysR family regulator